MSASSSFSISCADILFLWWVFKSSQSLLNERFKFDPGGVHGGGAMGPQPVRLHFTYILIHNFLWDLEINGETVQSKN